MSQFKKKVIKVVKSIPRGSVVSYGQVALYIGVPRAARQVGWILRGLDSEGLNDVPWWRVVNNEGRVSLNGNWNISAEDQRQLLLVEGVDVADDFTLDIQKYRFKPDQRFIQSLSLSETYLESIADKIDYNSPKRN